MPRASEEYKHGAWGARVTGVKIARTVKTESCWNFSFQLTLPFVQFAA